MTSYCKCSGKIGLGTSVVNGFTLDQEPFENGNKEMGEADIDIQEFAIQVSACIKCGKIHEAFVKEDFVFDIKEVKK